MIRGWQLLLVCLSIALTLAVFAVGLFKLSDVATNASDAARDAKDANAQAQRVASNAEAAARDAKKAIAQIQQNRVDVCQQANERHDAVIAELDRQIARLPAKRRQEAQARRQGTVALLEAITPRRDCRDLLTPH